MIRRWFETNLRIDSPSPTPGPAQRNIDHVLDAVRRYASARNEAPCGDNAHARKAKLDNQFKCLNCSFSSKTLDGLKRHMETKYPQEFWHCIECRAEEKKPFICSRPDKICDHLRDAHDITGPASEAKRDDSKVEYDAFFPNQCPFHNAFGRCKFKIGSWAAFVAHCAKHFRLQVTADGPWEFRRNTRRPREDEDPDCNGYTGSSGAAKAGRGSGQGSGSSSNNALVANGNRNGAQSSSNGYTSRCRSSGATDNAVFADMQLTLRTSVVNVRVDQANAVASRRPASLIDVDNRSVVDPPREAKYLALDYSLASKRCPHLKSLNLAHQTDQHTGLPVVKNYPAFFAEAIALTRDLGYQYLWIDLICEPTADYTKQLVVYEQANLIIVTCGSWAPPTHIWFFTCHFKSLRTVLSWTQDGQVAPSFSHVQHLGHGTYGVVDEVECRSTQDHFARKMFLKWKAGDKHQPTHLREIEMLRKLNHPNIARFVAAYFEKQTLNMLMQPVADCDLKDFLADPPRWSSKGHVIQRWFYSLASAVSYMHAASCRHKDIKPANILISGDDVLLSDFGIARDFSAGSSASQDGGLMTLKYCAPEIAKRARRGRKADIFSLGCVFAELITADLGQTVTEMNQYLAAKSAQPNRRIIYCQHTNTMKSWLVGLYARISRPYQRTVINLCIRMIDVDPSCRPSAAEICDILMSNTSTISDKNLVHQIESLTRSSMWKSMCEPRMPTITRYHRLQVSGGLASSPLSDWDRTRNDIVRKYTTTLFQRTRVLQEVALGSRRKKTMPPSPWPSHTPMNSIGRHYARLRATEFTNCCRSDHARIETPPRVVLSIGTGKTISTRSRDTQHSAVNDSWYPAILASDGGGIRGYSTLLILKRLMQKLQDWDDALSSACLEDNPAVVTLTHTSCREFLLRQDHPQGVRRADQASLKNSPVRRNDPSLGNLLDKWKKQSETFVWLRGKPGAGKKDLFRHCQGLMEINLQSDLKTSGSEVRSTAISTMHNEELFPCHYFDFMYGTSTGGLIANILARMRLSVTEALDVYNTVSRKIFSRRDGTIEHTETDHQKTFHSDYLDDDLSRLCGAWVMDGLDESEELYEKTINITFDFEADRNIHQKQDGIASCRTAARQLDMISLLLGQGLDVETRGAAATTPRPFPSWVPEWTHKTPDCKQAKRPEHLIGRGFKTSGPLRSQSWPCATSGGTSPTEILSWVSKSKEPLPVEGLRGLLMPDGMHKHTPSSRTPRSHSGKSSHGSSTHIRSGVPAFVRSVSSYGVQDPPPQDSTLSDPYHYRPLVSSGQEIRLLKLLPGCNDSPVNAELQTFDLSSRDVPMYDALSYTWGDRIADRSINIAGRSLQVHDSLSKILRTIRSTNNPCYLWIDAVCINQEDMVERASQVAAMQQIYTAADRVLVWLGTSKDDGTPPPLWQNRASAQIRLQHLLQAFAAKRKSDVYFDPDLGAFVFTENSSPEGRERDLQRWQCDGFDSQRSQEKLLLKVQCGLPALSRNGRNLSGLRWRGDSGNIIIVDGDRDADSAAALWLRDTSSRCDHDRERRHFSAHLLMILVFGVSSLLLALSLVMTSMGA